MSLNIINEAQRCLNCKKTTCQKGCPIGTLIPDVIHSFLNGEIDKAGSILFENNPLSLICSLICNQENQCEGHCILGKKIRLSFSVVLKTTLAMLILKK